MRRNRLRPSDNETAVDLTPMIDCVFLLLVFFILTTRIQPDEMQLPSLLPAVGPTTTVPQPIRQEIAIIVQPADLPAGLQPSAYRALLGDLRARDPALSQVDVRVGGSAPLRVDGRALAGPPRPEQRAQVDAIHAYVARELAAREPSAMGGRAAAPAVRIRAFSGLAWQHAALAFDAVRGYERGRGGRDNDAASIAEAREVAFVPPLVRNAGTNTIGDELYELAMAR